ncbi:MAG TPA: prolipoprotein diacylglyceryl transferase [Cyclobacteriaceae bacterium]|nr:prolipoprotein diacylglyceryl transferase [Cyclobacteriaceae bacterium]
MYPVLFELGPVTIYAYGFFIALGAIAGFSYMAWQGKIQFGTSLDKSNSLFLLMVGGGVVGGKLFIIFENPAYYLHHPALLFSGSGFVFYGSLITCIPLMLWFFRKNKIPLWPMLDIMAITTCILHGLGRIGCFMAGCCYGIPTDSIFGVIFTDPLCQAEPLHTALHPTQLYESSLIFIILTGLILLKRKRQFDGQLFLVYIMAYGAGRAWLEIYRGDLSRGFVIEEMLSNSQFISILMVGIALYFYVKRRNANLLSTKHNIHGK